MSKRGYFGTDGIRGQANLFPMTAEVALRAGMPGNPRGVVRALKLLKGVPWWRVVRADRTLAKEMVEAQAPRLRREGVRVEGRRVHPAKAPPPRPKRQSKS